MNCINDIALAMQKLGNIWFVKHIPHKKFFQFEGATAVLWEALVNSSTRDDAVGLFLEHYRNHPQALQNMRWLMNVFTQECLLKGSNTISDTSEKLASNSSSTPLDIQHEMYLKAVQEKRPLLVQYEMIYRCNLACLFCYQPRFMKRERLKELTEEEITAMLEDFKKAGVFFLIVTGGECTLASNFIHLVRQARRNLMDVTIFTNGTKLRQETIDLFAELNVSEVKVSVYGSSNEEYARFTGSKRAFDLVMENLRLLKKAGVHVVAKVVVTSIQEQNFRDTLKKLDDMGIETEVSCSVMPSLDGDCSPLEYRLSTSQIKQMTQEGYINFNPGCKKCTAGTARFSC